MKLHNLITATFLLGIGACSSPVGSVSEDGPVSKQDQALTASSPSSSAATATTRSSHAAAAAASLDTLARLVAKDEPKKRGFQSTAEVTSATLSAPLPVFMVGLYDLREYHPGQDPRPLLFDKQEVMYPISVSGEVRSSVVVKKRANGQWEPAEFGRMYVANAAHVGRQHVSRKRGIAEAALSLIEIPTVHARLLAHDERGVLMLTPIYDVPGTALHAGDTLPASEVFATLQPLAAQVDPSVPN